MKPIKIITHKQHKHQTMTTTTARYGDDEMRIGDVGCWE